MHPVWCTLSYLRPRLPPPQNALFMCILSSMASKRPTIWVPLSVCVQLPTRAIAFAQQNVSLSAQGGKNEPSTCCPCYGCRRARVVRVHRVRRPPETDEPPPSFPPPSLLLCVRERRSISRIDFHLSYKRNVGTQPSDYASVYMMEQRDIGDDESPAAGCCGG